MRPSNQTSRTSKRWILHLYWTSRQWCICFDATVRLLTRAPY
jgi:hypothetical protein